jgi:hypothetical protein
MPYEIEHKEGYVEVRASGQLSEWEVLAIIARMRMKDPLKRVPDVWILGPDASVPLPAFPFIARSIGSLFPPGFRGARSAIVPADGVQGAVAEMYRSQSKDLPFELAVFPSVEEALQWLRAPTPENEGASDVHVQDS